MPRRRSFHTSFSLLFLVTALLGPLVASSSASADERDAARPVHRLLPAPDGDVVPAVLGAPVPAMSPFGAPLSARPAAPSTAARSWYVSKLSGSLRADVDLATAKGCAQSRTAAPGLVTLGFGRQTVGGVTAFNRRRPTPLDHVVAIAAGFAAGLERCGTRPGQWTLLLAVSNYGGITSSNGANGGAAWALVVEVAALMSVPNSHVTIGGGIDMEPGWGPPQQGRAWVDGYVRATDRLLVNFGSADLCSRKPGRRACANGWTQDDVIHVSTAAGPSVWVAPEVYDHKGIMAGQWANIARRATELGTPLRFAGVMTQQAACAGSTEKACITMNLSPAEAWTTLVRLLDAARADRVGPFLSTDIGWGWNG